MSVEVTRKVALVAVFAAVLLGFTAGGAGAAEGDGPKRYEKTILSKPLPVRRIIKSMGGPGDTQVVTLLPEDQPAELVWITGMESKIVERDGETEASEEFMCHTNVDISFTEYKRLMYEHRAKPLRPSTARVATLSPGVLEVSLPEGTGLPVSSHQPMSLFMQVMNHNEPEIDTWLRQKAKITFVRDAELEEPMIPLRIIGAEGLKVVQGTSGVWNAEEPEAEVHGESCSMGEPVPGTFADDSARVDQVGQEFTSHWVVEPGVEVNHTNATPRMGLYEDTTLHYAIAHLHPFAESIELRDLTAGKTVFHFEVEPFADRIGIAEVEAFSSREGIPLYKDHQYQVVSRYDNTSGVEQDAMAVLILYVRDHGFY